MTVKVNECFNMVNILNKYSQKELPIKLAYRFSKLGKTLDAELEFFRKKITELTNEYAEKDADGNYITLDNGNLKCDPAKIPEYNQKAQEILSTEIDLDITPLSLSQMENLEMSMNEITLIESFITE